MIIIIPIIKYGSTYGLHLQWEFVVTTMIIFSVIIFEISQFRNIGRSTFGCFKC